MGNGIDLSDGFSLTWIWGAENNQNFNPAIEVLEDHRPVGAIFSHGKSFHGAIAFDLPESPGASFRWTVESWSPFTLREPLQCHCCGAVGMIQEGRWTPVQ